MSLKNDCSGIVLNADIKISNKNTTWNTRLSRIGMSDDELIIVTFSLAGLPFIRELLSKRPNGRGITLIANTVYFDNAVLLKRFLPKMRVIVNPNAHAKLILFGPNTVWLSSANIGHRAKSYDATIEIQNDEVYKVYHEQIDSLLRSRESFEITGEMV